MATAITVLARGKAHLLQKRAVATASMQATHRASLLPYDHRAVFEVDRVAVVPASSAVVRDGICARTIFTPGARTSYRFFSRLPPGAGAGPRGGHGERRAATRKKGLPGSSDYRSPDCVVD